jgi:hypothetical protein
LIYFTSYQTFVSQIYINIGILILNTFLFGFLKINIG